MYQSVSLSNPENKNLFSNNCISSSEKSSTPIHLIHLNGNPDNDKDVTKEKSININDNDAFAI